MLSAKSFMMEEIVVSAPGKIILFGEHAVVYGKLGIAASLDMRTTLKLQKTNNNDVSINFANVGVNKCWTIQDLETRFGSWIASNPNYPRNLSSDSECVLKEFIASEENENPISILAQLIFLTLYLSITKVNGSYPSLKITATTDLPVGSGLGSSASFSTCLATAFLSYIGALKIDRRSELTPVDLDLINQWAFIGEVIVHGKPSGIDNSICTYGGILKFQNGEITTVSSSIDLKILLVNTGIERSTKTLVANVQQLHKQFPKIISPVLDAIDAIAQIGCSILMQLCNREQGDSEEHYHTLEKLISMNQPLLETLGVSHTHLNKICHLAMNAGFQAKLTGAGGGGCAFILLPPYVDEKSLIFLKEKLKTHGYQYWETTVGNLGLTIDTII